MKLTLHLLHSDTDYGTEFQIFTSESALRTAQEQLMRDHRRTPPATLDLLNQPGRADEDFIAAWGAFTDALAERNDYYSIDEQEIEVPITLLRQAELMHTYGDDARKMLSCFCTVPPELMRAMKDETVPGTTPYLTIPIAVWRECIPELSVVS